MHSPNPAKAASARAHVVPAKVVPVKAGHAVPAKVVHAKAALVVPAKVVPAKAVLAAVLNPAS